MLTGIIDFVKRYPAVYDCDTRLQKLKAKDTVRNEYEAYSKLNGSNVPTLTELMEYSEWVSLQQMQDLQNPLKINDSLKYALHDGTFLRIRTDSDGGDHTKHIFSAPLTIRDVTRRDPDFLIEYQWLDAIDTKPAAEFLTFVNQNLKLSGTSRQNFAEFVYALISTALKMELVTEDPAPISIDGKGVVKVNFDTAGMDVASILNALRNFQPKSTNPRAFLSAFSYSLTGPLQSEIRKRAPPSFILPLHVSFGITGSGKTTTDSLFAMHGYAQSKTEALLGIEQVRTAFTLAYHLGDSNLPVILNDVNSEWLDRLSEQLKNLSESSIASDRGKPDQSIARREVKRSIFITLNQSITPGDDAARARRYIIESFDQENLKRQEPDLYNSVLKSLPEGFMFAIFREIYDGHNVQEIVDQVSGIKDAQGFVNYGLNLINQLCRKYGIDVFSLYDEDNAPTYGSPAQLLCEYLIDQWRRLHNTDDFGKAKPPYPELSETDIDVDTPLGVTMIWLTGSAYKTAKRRLELPFRTASDLINNIKDDPAVNVFAAMKSHKFGGISLKAFCLQYHGGGNEDKQ